MEAVNKKVIAETVAEKHNLTKKESAEIVDLVFDTVADALKDGAKVDIAGFGKFEVKQFRFLPPRFRDSKHPRALRILSANQLLQRTGSLNQFFFM